MHDDGKSHRSAEWKAAQLEHLEARYSSPSRWGAWSLTLGLEGMLGDRGVGETMLHLRRFADEHAQRHYAFLPPDRGREMALVELAMAAIVDSSRYSAALEGADVFDRRASWDGLDDRWRREASAYARGLGTLEQEVMDV